LTLGKRIPQPMGSGKTCTLQRDFEIVERITGKVITEPSTNEEKSSEKNQSLWRGTSLGGMKTMGGTVDFVNVNRVGLNQK